MEMHDINAVLSSSFQNHENPAAYTAEAIRYVQEDVSVLVVGAGGLGCEILKCLALSGFRRITVVDMDTIDVSNLNRQFLFARADVGRPKAEVAASCINARCGHLGVKVESVVCKLQDLELGFYSKFSIIIAGLDNIEARRWLNSTLFSLVRRDATGVVDQSSLPFFLDGGTEGLKGQARVIIPTLTACFECTIGTFPPVTTYPLCTIAETPRLPEHCVEYASTVLFPRAHPGVEFDPDDANHVSHVFEQASSRAAFFGIEGVTLSFARGVLKRIIPAVASTNALIAGVLVNEAFKIATYAAPVLNNYYMYMGDIGINGLVIAYEKNPDCLVCNSLIPIP